MIRPGSVKTVRPPTWLSRRAPRKSSRRFGPWAAAPGAMGFRSWVDGAMAGSGVLTEGGARRANGAPAAGRPGCPPPVGAAAFGCVAGAAPGVGLTGDAGGLPPPGAGWACGAGPGADGVLAPFGGAAGAGALFSRGWIAGALVGGVGGLGAVGGATAAGGAGRAGAAAGGEHAVAAGHAVAPPRAEPGEPVARRRRCRAACGGAAAGGAGRGGGAAGRGGGGGAGRGGGAAAGGGGRCGGAAAGGAGRGGAALGGGLGFPSGPTSPCCATTIGAVCASDAELANGIATIAVVASSTRRSFVMMVSIPREIGNKVWRSTNKHQAGMWRP